MYKVLELFGGIGAIRKAFINLDISHEIVDYVEWDKNAVKSYNALYNSNFEPQDIRDYHAPDIEIDIVMHGSPCQDFSVAGLRKGGVKDSGTRSSLLYETIRVIDELSVKPKIVIWENVKGVLIGDMQTTFYNYLEEMEKLGYESTFAILNSKDFGIPQSRLRVFTISMFGENTFDFSRLERKPAPNVYEFMEHGVDDIYTVQAEVLSAKINGVHRHSDLVRYLGDCAPTLTTRIDGKTGVYVSKEKFDGAKYSDPPNVIETDDILLFDNFIDIADRYRHMTERECWRLMGFTDEDFDKVSAVHPRKDGYKSSILYKQAGNSIVVQVLEAILKELDREKEKTETFNYTKEISLFDYVEMTEE